MGSDTELIYTFDEATGEYAHAAGVVILTPKGEISRYLFGLDPSPRDLRLALVESADGKIGGPVDQFLLFCFQYDPAAGKYSALALGSMRTLAALTLLGLGIFVGAALWRDRHREEEEPR